METYYVLNITKLRVFYNSAASCYRLHKPECTSKMADSDSVKLTKTWIINTYQYK